MLHYATGDATVALQRPTIIAHCCNDLGAWGRGFVLAISARWPHVRSEYIAWTRGHRPRLGAMELGAVQLVQGEPGITVANIIGQHGIGRDEHGNPPIRYDALRTGLLLVAAKARETGATVQMPRIGARLAGGDWARIEPLILAAMDGVEATVFDLPPR